MKKRLSNKEITAIANKFIQLKTKSQSGKKKCIDEFKAYQDYCAKTLYFLVEMKTAKYRNFDNYNDLKQVGYEALFMAMETFNSTKSDFSWWALQYIGTKVSRAANAHSTIRIPMSQTKKNIPIKVDKIPVIVDLSKNSEETIEDSQSSDIIRQTIQELPEMQKKAIELYYGFEKGHQKESIQLVMKNLGMSKIVALDLIKQAEDSLREKLYDTYEQGII